MKFLALCLFFGLAAATVINKEFLDGYNKLTGDVYKQVLRVNQGNFLISPISVDVLLALVEYGSAGETSQQLVKGLSLPLNKEKIREAFSVITPKLNVNDKYTLSSANKIYIKENYKLLEDFTKFAKEVYSAGLENINFVDNTEAANKMNKWVEEKTNNNIKDLVDKDQLGSDTRAVFINALYFRGNWVTKFDPKSTQKENFHLSDGSNAEVELMEVTSNYNFYDNRQLNAKFLELPYNGDDVTLTIVLPNDKDGLTNLEDKIAQVLETQRYAHKSVHVKLPKFTVETKTEFKDILKNLGIVRAFEDNAEFPKISGEQLKINKVIQKARIEVDEEGTTAAAASAADAVSRVAHNLRGTEQFLADHPFIFFLKCHSVVLFIGHYNGK